MSAVWLALSLYLPLWVFLGVVAPAAIPAGGQVVEIPRSALKPDPDNPRKDASPEHIAGLTASIKVRGGILVPLIIRADTVAGSWVIIDGWCRYLASGPAGLEKLPCIIVTQSLSPGQVLAMQMATVMHRADISGYEKWQACERLLKLNPSWQQKDLVPNLGVKDSMVVRLLSPGKCLQAWQDALKEGKVGISDCYEASKLDPKAQTEMLALKLSGASRDAIARAGRKHRNGNGAGNGDTVRLSRVRCPLPSGVQVTVAGKELSLADFIEALSDLIKEARRAADQGLDIKTLAAVTRDKATKKGT
jgi:ParB/RepB/Spo0J family partition protein